MKVPLFHSEADHPGVVQQYPILDTAPEQEFDDLTHLAAQICGTPFSALTLVDQDRQWFKSCFGFEAAEMPCEFSIQTHIILGQDLLIVSDTAADERYANNPLVASPPHIRFHAGLPLITHEGKAAGTLCVLDIVPRQLDPPQQDALRRLARLAVVRLEARPDAKLEDGHGRQEAEQLALTLETARLNAEILKASRERYQRLFEAAKDGILILDAASGEIEDVNPFLCELLGYSPSDFLGKQLWEIGTFRDIAANQDAFRTLQDKEYIRHDDLPLQTRDGQSVSVEFVSNVYWSNGKKVIQCNIRDITARKSTEAVAARLASIVASSDDAIISKTLDGIITTWNAGAQALYGYTAEEMIGQSISILVPSDMPNEMPQLLEKIGRGELVEHYETVRVDKDGNRKDISLSISPLRDAHGNIIGASSIKRDITQRKIAEQQLRMRSRLLNAIGQAVIVTDLAGTITYWNDSAVELYGWPASEALGQNILNVTPSNTTREQAAAILACLAQGERWSGELVVQRRDGTTFPAYVTDTPVWDAAGQAVGIIGLSLDISDRKRAELEGARLHAQIDEQRQRLNTIVATVPGLVWETWTQPDAVTGRTDFVSDYIGTMLGYSVNDWLETPNFWLTIIHPDDKERAAREVAAIYAGGRGGTT
jgi:PAS domain S-box-containing protein